MDNTIRVLVVEDSDLVATAVCALLEAEKSLGGFTSELATTLAEAIQRIENGGIDAVILDLSLEDAKEAEALVALRERWFYLPIIVLTGIGPDRWLEMIEAGACDFFAKGQFAVGSLTEAVRKSVIRRGVLRKFAQAHESQERTGLAINDAREEVAAIKGEPKLKLKG